MGDWSTVDALYADSFDQLPSGTLPERPERQRDNYACSWQGKLHRERGQLYVDGM